MTGQKCKVCYGDFFEEALLCYGNMPAVAQCLPDENGLADDSGVDLNIYQCSECGLIQLDSEPVAYYREVIRAAGFSDEMKSFRRKQFKKFIDKYSLADKSIIELGCGCGEYLGLMKECCKNVFGLEAGKESVKKCIENNLNVVEGYVENEDYRISNAPFDAFFTLNFLEHVPNINSFLKGIYNNLSENAIGLVEVPNFDMLLKNNVFSEFMKDHLYYFTQQTLKRTLEINGFDVIEIQPVWYDYILSAVVKRREKTDLVSFHKVQAELEKEVDAYIVKHKKIAIWGAGHQAFAVMSLLDLGAKIEYVVDSAPFKQGRFTPATHIPIVAPEKLKEVPVEAVIVMAGSYSDEVSGIIKQNYGSTINTAVLRNTGLEIV